jgi:SAM-dependent methyltransferase
VFPKPDSEPSREQEIPSDPTPPEAAVENVVSGLRALASSSPPDQGIDEAAAAEMRRQDARAAVYDELFEIRQPCFRLYEDWITEAVYSAWYEGRGRLLVVGCGTGTLVQRLVQRMPARLITAIDLSQQMTRRAREKAPSIPEVRAVPFTSFHPVVPFDVVVLNGSLAAMPDLSSIADHTASMTLHGSRVVICVRNGDWRAGMRPPAWYWQRLINRRRIAEAAALGEGLSSPHSELTAARIKQAFGGRFGLRDERTDFGVTRLFESVLVVPRNQALQTVGMTRERRPWMGTAGRLRKADAVFAKRHPMGGGLLAMLFDKLH